MQSHRISTNIGKDQLVTVELKQDYDLLEILSLKFSQQDVYTSLCSDYGVVCGRISVNNGLGIPNARVSIFVPLKDIHANDPVISLLYPYTSVTDKDENGYRYNLLPSRQQHSGQEATGTFPDQRDILTREEYLEVYENYYSYTVKTNNSGDFMIWGVPLGYQKIHVDVDLSDIGCFSLRPDDFIRQGMGVDKFQNSYKFKASNDLSALPQIVSFDKSIEVYPFWGNVELCDIGITRTDFDLSEKGVKVEPKAYFLGSIFSDQGNNAVNKNCIPTNKMGDKCSLISEPAQIEVIRFTPQKDNNHRPILEVYELHEDIGDDGAFVLPVPMNMDYMYTDEFGENVITNDPNKGVPTAGCYRFRISTKNHSLGRVRTVASYLVPNIREYTNDVEKSYAWSTNWTDYPSSALNENVIFSNEQGVFYPKDYFYRFNYNKVYGVSSFMGSYFSSGGIGRSTYLGIKEISPKTEDDCENSVVTPPVNFGIQKFTFAILLSIIVNTFERLIYYAFIAAVQVLIAPFQALYNFRIYARALGVTIIDWRPFGFFDTLVIEPLQRFGTIRLGIAIYPECETCDNLDYSNELPNTDTNPEILYTEVAHGNGVTDVYLKNQCGVEDFDEFSARIFLLIPSGTTCTEVTPTFIDTTITDIVNNAGRYIIKFTETEEYGNLSVYGYDISGATAYYYDDTTGLSYTGQTLPTGNTLGYKIFDSQSPLNGGGGSGVNSELEGGCQQYVTAYDESMVSGTYCVTNSSTPYNSLTAADITSGISCAPNKFKVGQVIKSVNNNPCNTCSTKSGYSEFRYGLFTIVPAAATGNWGVNFKAITEYSKRKLVAKLFCEGVSNYSFLDNWLTGSLYFFPFKAKVRWANEAELQLNFGRTKYCPNLVYFKPGTIVNPDKRFYYRSTRYNGTTFDYDTRKTLNHPTTIVDLGPRDEFIKEICVDPSLDPNCSVVRNIGPTSYQNFKEMLGLYINYKMDYLGADGSYTKFFNNSGFNSVLPNKMDGYVMNGDILQLISINNEAGIEEFDLQNRNYAVYSPQILDVEEYPTLLDGGPIPLNLVLDDGNGYRVRACLNEPGRLTESSQDVPFFLWNKNGTGFGVGTNQSWNYSSVQKQPLQGMTYGYKYSGDTTHKYILLPMTKEYSGNTFVYTGLSFNDVHADIQTLTPSHTNYNYQEEGFTVLEISSGTLSNPKVGTLWIRKGEVGNWVSTAWTSEVDFIIKPTSTNYEGNYQILSTPFLFYFGLRPGKTAVDKFIERFGPLNAFPKPVE
jgi:hypothetical protein